MRDGARSARPALGRRRAAVSAPRGWLRGWLAPLLLALGCAMAATLAAAQTARPLADDPVLEAQVMRIAEELRCLVCQNETIAASQADLAVDLRQQIRLIPVHIDQSLKSILFTAIKQPVDWTLLINFQMICIKIFQEIITDYFSGSVAFVA